MKNPISIQAQLSWAKKQKRCAMQRATVKSLQILLDKTTNPNSELYIIASHDTRKVKKFLNS
jgi:hypothetical protein